MLEGAKVSRPVRTTKVLVSRLDETVVSSEEVRGAFLRGFGGEGDSVRSFLHFFLSKVSSAWVKCPAEIAARAVAVGRLRVGWVSARVRALCPRPLQCYRCLEPGHCRMNCNSSVDRSNVCYRCDKQGQDHVAATCRGQVRCPLCQAKGRDSAYRMGGAGCPLNPG